ncbi:MAG: hypothetical protein AAFY88_24130, partial [Acidobacteriota bacterium]
AEHVEGDRWTDHISASLTEEAAERFASGNGLIAIDVDLATWGSGVRFIDHKDVLRAVRSSRALTKNRKKRAVRDATRAEEVLFRVLDEEIPFEAITLIRNY